MVYCILEIVWGRKFCGFHGLIGNHKSFPVVIQINFIIGKYKLEFNENVHTHKLMSSKHSSGDLIYEQMKSLEVVSLLLSMRNCK